MAILHDHGYDSWLSALALARAFMIDTTSGVVKGLLQSLGLGAWHALRSGEMTASDGGMAAVGSYLVRAENFATVVPAPVSVDIGTAR